MESLVLHCADNSLITLQNPIKDNYSVQREEDTV